MLVFSGEKRPVAIGDYKEILNNYDLLLRHDLVHRHRHDNIVHEHEHLHGHMHKQ